MKAAVLSELGEPGTAVRVLDMPVPEPGPGQILVRVLGCAANFPDVLMCRGGYQVKPVLPFIPGIEVCGVVVALGAGVDGAPMGARVVGLTDLPAGGFAEFALLDSTVTFPAPAELDDAEAAALFVSYQTGWFGLHRRAQLKAGQTLLVHAAAGGVGSAAVELGKAAGARVIGVVGGPQKVEVARALGADVVIDRHSEDFVEVVLRETAGRGADVVYDPVGGEAYRRSTKCIAYEGRILLVGFAGGEIQTARLNHPLNKNYSIVGYVWGGVRIHDLPAVRVCHDELLRLVTAGQIKPLVGERVDLSGVPAGLQRLADGRTVGRVVFEA